MTTMRWYPLLALAVLLLVLMAAGVVWAQRSANHDLSWNVISGGGREGMTSGAHTVHGTLGQFAIGPAQSDQHQVGAGYWYGVPQGQGETEHHLFLPIAMKNRQ